MSRSVAWRVLAAVACVAAVTLPAVAADCEECWGKSSGPCRHDGDWTCFERTAAGACPAGTHECKKVDCEVSEWGTWSACDAKCGGGSRVRSRTVKAPASHGGAACPVLKEWAECNTHSCVETASCSACAKGTSGVCQHIKNGVCSGLNKLGKCDAGTELCTPINCQVSEWGKWSKCTATCGGGDQSRTRAVVVAPSNGGDACPTLLDARRCNTHMCEGCAGCAGKTHGPCMSAKDGDYTCFGYYEGTEQCPAGTTACVVKDDDLGSGGGKPGKGECAVCLGKSSGPCVHDAAPVCHPFTPGTTTCPPGTHMCKPINCKVSEWSKWGKCSATCGGGTQSRARSVIVKPDNGGMECPDLTEDRSCNEQSCKPACNRCAGKSSGPCQHNKDGTCFPYVKGTKDACPAGTTHCAAVDCVVGAWGKWGKCSAPCGGGTRLRSRTVLVKPSGGGSECPALTDTESCNKHKCSVCTGCLGKSSGPCQQTNVAVCHAYYPGGTTCPPGTVDCTKGEGGKKTFGLLGLDIGAPGDGMCEGCFGKSSGPCRHIKDDSCHAFTPGTTDCPAGTLPCNPVDCEVSPWSLWTKCSASCGSGTQSRFRKVLTLPGDGGALCPDLTEERVCNAFGCIAECTKCANGSEGPCQGLKSGVCSGYAEEKVDGMQVCPKGTRECVVVDCVMSDWTEWGKCSASCGGGVQTRTRKVLVEPSANGKRCPKTVSSTRACNAHKCNSCTDCLAKTDGPCQNPANKVCYDYQGGTTCPPGTVNCKSFDNTYEDKEGGAGDAGDGYCTKCVGKSAGPCRSVKDGSCHMYEGYDKEWDGEDWEEDVDSWKDDEWEDDWDKRPEDDDNSWDDDGEWFDDDDDEGDWYDGPVNDDRRRLSPSQRRQARSSRATRGRLLREVAPSRAQRRARSLSLRSLVEEPTCPKGTVPCMPVSCAVSEWSAWTKCSATCDGGTQTRTRKVVTEASNGGMKCPPLSDERPCGTTPCKTDCRDSCTSGSGPCRSLKDGSCSAFADKGKSVCPKDFVMCKDTDCVVTDWSAWGKCSATCGGGTKTRTRAVLVKPFGDGAACPTLTESMSCNEQKCSACVGCAGKSSGSCMQVNNNVCHAYYEGTTTCPPGTVDCKVVKRTFGSLEVGEPGDGMCSGCYGKSAGPCRHVKDTSCFGYMAGTTTCPPGSAPCQPSNCQVSEWGEWGVCSASCGGGTQERVRRVTKPPSDGGAACPDLTESRPCNEGKCSPKCDKCVGKSSGPCRHIKDGSCFQYLADGTCPAGTTECADADCVVGAWGAWGACSTKCGGGVQSRSRDVLSKAKGSGLACPALSESRDCNEFACDGCTGCVGGTSGFCKHDKAGTCYDYFPGTKQCYPGTTACTVKAATFSLLGGKPGTSTCDGCFGKSSGPCKHNKDSSCYAFVFGTTTCPAGTHACTGVDCVVSEWGAWGKCSASCDGGWQTRARTVKVAPTDGGMRCPELEESRVCNSQACQPSCEHCVGGTSGPCKHDKDGTCTGWSKAGAGTCPAGTSQCDVVDCQVSAWSKWSACDATCGGGSRYRSRDVTVKPTATGAACPQLKETESCNTHKCSECIACAGKSSGPCQHNKDATCFPFASGTTCPAGTTACKDMGDTWEDKDDEGGEKGDGMCRGCVGKSSGPCQHEKDGSCFAYVAGTKECPAGTNACKPSPCVVSPWSAWGKCSAKCDGGSETRSRTVVSPPANGGMKCPVLEQSRDCNTHACVPDCVTCAGKSAGPCRHDKDGTCHAYAKGSIATCPAGTHECAAPVNCQVSDWAAWSKCDAKCDGGWQTRSRKVTVSPANGGDECPELSQGRACNTLPCSSCSACAGKSSGPCQAPHNGVCYAFYKGSTTCPAGTIACAAKDNSVGKVAAMGIDIDILVLPPGLGNGGAEEDEEEGGSDGMCGGCFGKSAGPCQHIKDTSCYPYFPGTTTCPPGTRPCTPTNCQVSEWTKWSKCDAVCGGGMQQRTRKVLVEASNGGLPCPTDLAEELECNTHECPIQCDECAAETSGPCQSGVGSKCVDWVTGTKTCPKGTTQCAPVDCVVGDWSKWGACDATCGGGQHTRTRKVKTPAANGGAACPHLSEVEDCNDHPCDDCAGCLYKSSGPCMHNKVPVCYGYYAGTTVCPAGTRKCSDEAVAHSFGLLGGKPGSGKCSDCAGKSSGPCRHDKDGTCFDFYPGTTKCPAGTSACAPSNCVLSEWGSWSKCTASCGGGTRTRSRFVVKRPSNGGMECPDSTEEVGDCNTHKCGAKKEEAPKCGACVGKSSGPCRQLKDNVCYDYYWGTDVCPAGTAACMLCPACAGKSSGPCQHVKDGTCFPFASGTTCPAGTRQCGKATGGGSSDGGDDDGAEDGMCTGCWPGTTGPCQSSNTVCYGYFPGSKSCPAGTVECKAKGSLKPKPLVVFDVRLENVSEEEFVARQDAFVANVADAAGVMDAAVVIENVQDGSVSPDSRRRLMAGASTVVGFVVVTDDPSATEAAVLAAASANVLGDAVDGQATIVNAQSSGTSAGAGSGALSPTLIAMVAAGVAIVAVAAAVVAVRARNSDGGRASTVVKLDTRAGHMPVPTSEGRVSTRTHRRTTSTSSRASSVSRASKVTPRSGDRQGHAPLGEHAQLPGSFYNSDHEQN